MTTPNMRVVEIAITYLCNVRCHNCNSLCTQAPTGRSEDMSLDDIKAMLDESVSCGYAWGALKLFGGEPTLHPQFMEICEALVEYKKKHNSGVGLYVVSNGANPPKVDASIAMGFLPLVSVKTEGNPCPYVTVNVSPVDQGLRGKPCRLPVECGIALNKRGFWPCSPAASAARVFGYESPAKSVASLTAENLMKLYCHCDHCGFALEGEPRSASQVSSPSWESRLRAYNEKCHV